MVNMDCLIPMKVLARISGCLVAAIAAAMVVSRDLSAGSEYLLLIEVNSGNQLSIRVNSSDVQRFTLRCTTNQLFLPWNPNIR